jgi:kynurenine formamidase
MNIIDLTQTVTHQMQVYPGDTPPVLRHTHTLAGDGYTNHRLTTEMHVGTHIDGTWHMMDDCRLISGFSIHHFIGKACVIDISREKEFNNSQYVKEKAEGCHIVLFHTGYGKFFGTDKYLAGYPLVGDNVAREMVASGIKLVGIDTFSPDIAPYQTHKTLLGNGVLIAENLANLHLLLSETTFQVIALPLKIAADSAPARVIAILDA